MPRHDPIASSKHSALRRHGQIMRYMALVSLLAAAGAVALVAWGSDEWRVHMLIATALGAGLSVLLAAALMGLIFMSSSSGHDEQASRFEGTEKE